MKKDRRYGLKPLKKALGLKIKATEVGAKGGRPGSALRSIFDILAQSAY
jgi:hypothetical protein